MKKIIIRNCNNNKSLKIIGFQPFSDGDIFQYKKVIDWNAMNVITTEYRMQRAVEYFVSSVCSSERNWLEKCSHNRIK